MSYFSRFPKTKQNGISALDITRRVLIKSEVDGVLYNYVPYEVKEGERPEDVAYFYYGDTAFAWLVLLANNITDFYTEWPKSQRDLDAYIIQKYADQAGTTGQAVIDWTQNETIQDNVVYYAHRRNGQIRLSVDSWLNFPDPVVDDNNPATPNTEIIVDQEFVQADFFPVRYYEYEFEINELRKKIVLFDQRFLATIDTEVNLALAND